MHIINKSVPENFIIPTHFIDAVKNENLVIFDIETTGLSHQFTKVILVGIITYIEGELNLTQILCESEAEEKELLIAILPYFQNNKHYISFNGNAFDIPYLNSRFKFNNIDYQISKHYSFDILKFVREHKQALNLENYKLKTIEAHLGIHREDTISGKESVELYKIYAETGEIPLRDKILLHNYEDILHMIPLLDITKTLGYQDFINSLPNLININSKLSYGISQVSAKEDYATIVLEPVQFTNNSFYKTFGTNSLMIYKPNYSILSDSKGFITIRVPIFKINISSSDGPKKLIILDVDLIDELSCKFNDLSNAQKQTYILKNNSKMVKMNIARIAIDLIAEYIKVDRI